MGSYQFTFNICNSVCGVSLHVGRAPHTAQLVLHTHVLWLHFPTAVVRLWDFVPSEMFAAWYYISCFHHSFKDISLCLNRICVCCYGVLCSSTTVFSSRETSLLNNSCNNVWMLCFFLSTQPLELLLRTFLKLKHVPSLFGFLQIIAYYLHVRCHSKSHFQTSFHGLSNPYHRLHLYRTAVSLGVNLIIL